MRDKTEVLANIFELEYYIPCVWGVKNRLHRNIILKNDFLSILLFPQSVNFYNLF
jgi:hypothetical protein